MKHPVVRLLTCGSVDDGKSTLIGRLLVETDSVPHDTVASARTVRRSGSTVASGEIDFSLLTDGLEAEREQGITIDVAYRSMSLLNGARLIISDAPGHEQYTRNMAVAASRADIALVLVDATKGIRTQTLRHLTICALMGVSKVIVTINKLDAKGYSEDAFNEISREITKSLEHHKLKDTAIIPISALAGDNVVFTTTTMPWYKGPTLLNAIQDWAPEDAAASDAKMRVQMITRATDFRGVSGTVSGGEFKVGDDVKILPSGQQAKIAGINLYKENLQSAGDMDAITFVLEPEVDATRGDTLILATNSLEAADRYSANIVWLNEEPLIHSRSYMLVAGPIQVPATIAKIKYKLDVNTGTQLPATELQVNEIANVEVVTDFPIYMLAYQDSREYGNFVLVDRQNFKTLGAGMINFPLRRSSNVSNQSYEVDKAMRGAQKNQKPKAIWLTGLSGSGKSTVANALANKLFQMGLHAYVLDGDNLRHGINSDLGFTPGDRAENVRRVSEISKLMVDSGLIVISALVSPFESDRNDARSRFESGEFVEVFIDTPVEVCEARDPKGLYKKAAAGEIPNFTGVGQAYERPLNPDLKLDGTAPISEMVTAILKWIL